jgi:hypothetical protein
MCVETGSGKTTQLTQYLLEEGYGQNGIIGCTVTKQQITKASNNQNKIQTNSIL